MTDIIIIAIIALVLGSAIAYIVKAKKSGAKCIGCPTAKSCGAAGDAGVCGSCRGCSGEIGECHCTSAKNK